MREGGGGKGSGRGRLLGGAGAGIYCWEGMGGSKEGGGGFWLLEGPGRVGQGFTLCVVGVLGMESHGRRRRCW